jgi:hypothetical protein
VTKGEDIQKDWSAAIVLEIESLPVWEIEVHQYDDGWYASLTKRECWLLYLQEVFPQEAKVSGMWEYSLAPYYPLFHINHP